MLTPHWVEGLSLSADWYSINIKKAIATIGTSTILAQCAAGVQVFCSQLTYTNGILTQIAANPINANSQSVSGLDFQGDYQTDSSTGALDLHLVGNYIDEQTQTAVGSHLRLCRQHRSGLRLFAVFRNSAPPCRPPMPKVRGRARFRAASSVPPSSTMPGDRSTWTTTASRAVAYLDLRASYKWTDNIQLYGAIDNVINTPPPITGGSSAVLNFYDQSIRDDIYDAIGRSFRLGVRVKY